MKRLIASMVLVSVTSVGWASAEEQRGGAFETSEATVESAPVDLPAEPVAQAPTPAPVVSAPVPLTSLPPTQRYRDHLPPPPGYVLEEQVRRGLLIPGISVVGAAYISGLLVTGVFQNFPNKTGYLAVPLAGPWITMVARDSSCDEDSIGDRECARDVAVDRLLVLDGLVQAIGAALIVTGVTWTKSLWVREDLASIDVVPGLRVAKLPGMPEPHGLSVVGTF